MPEAHTTPGKKLYAFFLLWLGALVGAYWYFFLKPKQWFDPSQQQPPALTQSATVAALRTELHKVFPSLELNKPALIRFKNDSCSCERFVETYHQSIVKERKRQTKHAFLLKL